MFFGIHMQYEHLYHATIFFIFKPFSLSTLAFYVKSLLKLSCPRAILGKILKDLGMSFYGKDIKYKLTSSEMILHDFSEFFLW